jgi:hypothetical protein
VARFAISSLLLIAINTYAITYDEYTGPGEPGPYQLRSKPCTSLELNIEEAIQVHGISVRGMASSYLEDGNGGERSEALIAMECLIGLDTYKKYPTEELCRNLVDDLMCFEY